MNIRKQKVLTYFLSLNKTEAQDLLNIACVDPQQFPNLQQIKTLGALRETLLGAGLTKTDCLKKDPK